MVDPETIFTEAVCAGSAYAVAEVSPQMLKLDAMESPQDFPPSLRTAWSAALAEVALNRYPPAHHHELEALLRRVFAIDEDFGVVCGNGSDELIQLLLLACARPGAAVLAPAPTFVMYRLGAEFLGMRYCGVDLRADFSLDMAAMLAAIAREKPALLFLAQPNNPTGAAYDEEDVRTLIAATPGLVVLDEAYFSYADGSLAHLAREYDNVVVLRTLSKTGFAGLRFGYLFGARRWTQGLEKVRPPYNVNVLTQASMVFALRHYEEIAAFTATLRQERERLLQALEKLPGCRSWRSQANFLLLRTPDAASWFAQLQAQQVLVKNLHGSHPLLQHCLRLTVSNEKENQILINALEQCR